MDFATIKQEYAALQSNFCSSASETAIFQYNIINFVGDDSGLQVFSVKAGDLNNTRLINFNLPNTNATVFITVQSDNNDTVHIRDTGINLNGIQASNILWVICPPSAGGHTTSITNVKFQGSLLTSSAVQLSEVDFKGTLIAGSVTADSTLFRGTSTCFV